jgi:hypothetical protein
VIPRLEEAQERLADLVRTHTDKLKRGPDRGWAGRPSGTLTRVFRLLPLGVAGALALPAAAAAASLPDFDVRDGLRAAAPGAPVRAARAELRRRATLRIDPATQTVRLLLRRGHALTRPSGAPARRIARRYLAAHAQALGLDAHDIAAFGPARVVRAPGGLRTVRFSGEVGGIGTFDSAVTVGIDRAGRIVMVTGRPEHGLAVPSTAPRVGAAAAKAAFARSTGEAIGGHHDFARLVIFAAPDRDRLAWHVGLGDYDGVVDATTGVVLRRRYLVREAAAATVFPNFPGAPAGGAQVPVDLEAPGWLAPGATTLSGPFVRAYADTMSADEPGVEGEVPRTAAGDFVYPFKTFGTATPRCDPVAPCSWSSSTPDSWLDNKNQTTVQAFFFANVWHDHLQAAPIGFDKASGNFADDDPVIAQTDDGAGLYLNTPFGLITPPGRVNNASMATPANGSSPTLELHLNAWDDAASPELFRDNNNSDDAATVYHEYTHGLTSRLVTHADGSQALDSEQAAAMGEAWSDWYAFDFLVRNNLSPDTTAPGEVDLGRYSDAVRHTTRTQGLDCPLQTSGSAAEPCPGTTGAGPGGYTYGDFAKIAGGAEEHADGEIWGETLWDLRTALVATEEGQSVGSDVAQAIVTGGLRLAPPEPSFLDMRDAILQSDVALFGGAHMATLWTVFAARGMGIDATTTGGDDTAPKEGFKVPDAGTLTGTLAARPATVDPGGRVDFDASSFLASSNLPKGFTWDFDGDGKVDRTSDGPVVAHTYDDPGSYMAHVRVTDTGLSTGTATTRVTVRGPAQPPTDGGPTQPGSGRPRSPGDGPRLRVAKRGKLRYTLRVVCRPSCVVRVRARLTRRTARRLGVTNRRVRSLVRTARGNERVDVHVGRRLVGLARARGLRALRVRVRASARRPSGAGVVRRRTVRVVV